MQESWQVHEEPLDATKGRGTGYSCLDPELLGADAEKCDWANTEFVGYSWFEDDQFAATKDLPFFDAMMTRPPEVNFTGQMPAMVVPLEKRPTTSPPTIWLP